MTKRILLTILCASFGHWLSSQSLAPSVIGVASEKSISTNFSLEWTLGEFAVNSLDLEKGMLTEGFHQPLIESIEVPGEQQEHLPLNLSKASAMEINAWPNPVHALLNIQIESNTEEEIFIELIDVIGRTVISKSSQLPFGSVQLDVSQNPPGLYLLKFLRKDGTLIKTILNTKH